MDDSTVAFGLFASLVISILFLICVCCGFNDLKQEAIKLGYAQYNPTNSQFEWKENKR